MIFSGKFRNDKGAPFTRGSPEGGHPGGGTPMGRIPQIVSWAALAAAGFISFRGVFRASLLGFRIVGDSNSELAKYEQAVGDVVSGWMLLAFGLVVFGAALSFFLRRKHRLAANATAVVLAAASIVLTVGTGSRIKPMLEPYRPEIAMLDTFVPPPEWTLLSTNTNALFHPSAARFWRIPGSLPEVCASVETALKRWADPGTTVSKPNLFSTESCKFEARKGQDNVKVDLHFVYVYDPPATVSILLERIKEVRPEDLA